MAGVTTEMRLPVPLGFLAAKAWGPPEGRPVLCLHGRLDNANTFDRLIPLLPTDCYYVALDFSGHGLSSHWAAGFMYHHFNYVLDVLRAVEALNWSRFTIMGHSLGGLIGGIIAIVFPYMVDKLILLDSYGFLPYKQEELLGSASMIIKQFLALDRKKNIKVYSPEEALKRLLKANSLTEESGRILLQRGTKKVPGGVTYSRDIKATVINPFLFTVEQCVEFLKNIDADVLIIVAKDGMGKSKLLNPEGPFGKVLLQGFRTSLKERCCCVFSAFPG
ncbi:serine hydrolase-like protein 2 isoform X2 [Rhinatrema bivittatum]|uniref:serine hydrolase-like protein 2 isoform X2 n=1 Tax=Rhinatrema bivittatum TaxID=194408 RepID=UPI00112B807A|nr:serine hydrolase-like protein 2 isoform X2 [Rhinatrema bivittatum]